MNRIDGGLHAGEGQIPEVRYPVLMPVLPRIDGGPDDGAVCPRHALELSLHTSLDQGGEARELAMKPMGRLTTTRGAAIGRA